MYIVFKMCFDLVLQVNKEIVDQLALLGQKVVEDLLDLKVIFHYW